MARYSGFIGQTGGSGGDGNYAVISISYDVGENVIVEHNGETYEAPDTSGIWLFGCEEAGTYVCSLVNALIPQSITIEITESGQIKYANLSTQIIHYTPIYLYGDECNGITGGWTYPTDSGSGSSSSGASASKIATTNNTLQTSNYTGRFILAQFNTNDNKNNKGGSVYAGNGYPQLKLNITSRLVGKENKIGYSNLTSIATLKPQLYIGSSFTKAGDDYWSYNWNTGKDKTNFRSHTGWVTSTYGASITTRMYGTGFTQSDDISIMSDYGNTINNILANSIELFKDGEVLSKMVKTCTGNFMFSALGNSNFVSAMNDSDNKYILLANEHWSKFISFLSM